MGKGDWGFHGIDAFGEQFDGTAGARACTIQGVIKQNWAGSKYLVANEFICGRLALLMGLPTPPGSIVQLEDGTLGYVSLRFGPKGESPPPILPADFAIDHPELALCIVCFDCWIANDDRHESNIAYSRGVIPPMIFDHDKALLGPVGPERLEDLEDQPILNGCLASHVRNLDGVTGVSTRARWVADNSLEGICDEAVRAGAIEKLERQQIVDFLKARATRLAILMSKLAAPGQRTLI